MHQTLTPNSYLLCYLLNSKTIQSVIVDAFNGQNNAVLPNNIIIYHANGKGNLQQEKTSGNVMWTLLSIQDIHRFVNFLHKIMPFHSVQFHEYLVLLGITLFCYKGYSSHILMHNYAFWQFHPCLLPSVWSLGHFTAGEWHAVVPIVTLSGGPVYQESNTWARLSCRPFRKE